MRYSTEDDELSFVTLGAATLNVVRYLQFSATKPLAAEHFVPPAEAAILSNDDNVSGQTLGLGGNHLRPELQRKEHQIEHIEHDLTPIDERGCDEPGHEKSKPGHRDTTPDKAGGGKLSDVCHAMKKRPGAEAPGSLPNAQGGGARRVD
ncbi:hypothetical protein ACVIYH_009088 [Bradyrhizobium diazoefficiens]